jgi:hypothetical protein
LYSSASSAVRVGSVHSQVVNASRISSALACAATVAPRLTTWRSLPSGVITSATRLDLEPRVLFAPRT